MKWRPANRHGGEVGAATLEYAGAFALAAALVLGLIGSAADVHLGSVVEQAICQVKTAAGMGSCSNSGGSQEPPTEPPFEPKPKKCKVNEKSEKVSAAIKIAFITFGQNAGFVETTYSDGSVTFTATDGAGLGLEGGVGAKIDIGKLKAGDKVDFGGGLKFEYGSSWTFKDAKEAEAMRKQLNEYLAQQEAMKIEGGAIGVMIAGAVDPPKPPTQTVSTIEVEGSASYGVGLTLPWEDKKEGEDDKDPVIPDVKLANAGVKFGGSHKWTQINNSETGNTTWTTGSEGYAQANGTVGPISGELKGVAGTSMAITRDKDGKIVNVTLVTTHEGSAKGTIGVGQNNLGGQSSASGADGNLTVTTTSLDVANDQDRAVVDAWLHNGGLATSQTLKPTEAVPGDDLQNLFFSKAQVSNVEYDHVTDSTGFAAEVKIGVALGVDFSLTTDETSATDASYLDAPDADGLRQPVDFEECIAK